MSSSRLGLARLALEGLRTSERQVLLREFNVAHRQTATEAAEPAALLNQKEASRYLGISRQTMYRWSASGVVSPVVINGVHRFRRSDLEQLARTGSGGGQ